MWTTLIKDTVTGKVRVMRQEECGTKMDLVRFERHVVPFTVDGDWWVFGIHQFGFTCRCRPKIELDNHGYEVVMHADGNPN